MPDRPAAHGTIPKPERRRCMIAAFLLFALLLSACGTELPPIFLAPLAESPPASEGDTELSVSVRTVRGAAVPALVPTPEPSPIPGVHEAQAYVLNQNSKRFHLPGCPSVSEMKPENRADILATREELLDLGYMPCGNCKP